MTLYQPNMPASIPRPDDEKDLYPAWVEDKLLVVNEAQTIIWIQEELGESLVTSAAPADLNSSIANGDYLTETTTLNSPSADRYYVRHVNKPTPSTDAMQTAYEMTYGYGYMRVKEGGTWSAWRVTTPFTVSAPANVNNITSNGKYYSISSNTNNPTADAYYIEHVNDFFFSMDAMQTATRVSNGYTYKRLKNAGSWGAWVLTSTLYITPSDTVLLSLPTERTGSGTLKTFKLDKAGKYRIKGDYRSTSGGFSATFDFRYGISSAGNLTADQSSGMNTTSSTYAAFSIDLPYVPANTHILMYGQSDSANIQVRNVTVCGSVTLVNPNTAVTGTD